MKRIMPRIYCGDCPYLEELPEVKCGLGIKVTALVRFHWLERVIILDRQGCKAARANRIGVNYV